MLFFKQDATRMRRIICYSFFIFQAIIGQAQTFSVSSFKLLDTDLTANTDGTMEIDQNGETAALIKVVTTQTGFTFDGGALGIVKTKQTPGEIWVYIPRGSKKISIKHAELGVLRDYYFPCSIESGRTYEMVLISGEVQTIVKQARTSQYVVFNLTPPDAVVELDGELLKTEGGVASKMMKFGTYNYRIKAPDYLSEAGAVTIDDPNNKKVVNISLKPNFAQVTIKVDNNAEIWVNGEKKGAGSWTGNLGAGTYELEAKKAGHRSTMITRDIEVTPEPQIILLQTPIPVYGEADINSSPGMADIYIDGKKVGQTPQLISKLLIGAHDIRIIKEGYDDYVSEIVIKELEQVKFHADLIESSVSQKIKDIKTSDIGLSEVGDKKIGIADTKQIIQAMPEYAMSKAEIDRLQAQYEADLKSMQEELQKKGEAFDREQGGLSENVRFLRQQELQDLYQKIQQAYQNNQDALKKVSETKMLAIQNKVLNALKSIGDNGGYAFVYEEGSSPFINPSYVDDLTSLVEKELGLISSVNKVQNCKSIKNAKFGRFESSEIISVMPEFIKAQKEIDALQDKYQTELSAMQDEYQKKSEALDKEQSTLSDSKRMRIGQELQELYQKIQQKYQDNQETLQKACTEKMQPIQKKVLDAVKIVGRRGDYAIIYENGSVLFLNQSYNVDVTSLIKKELGLITKAEDNSISLNGARFGYVDTQVVLQAMPEYAIAKNEIDGLQAKYEADLKSMQDELQKKGEAFDKEQANLPENIKQRRQTELQEMYQKNQQALQKASAEKMQAIQAKVMEVINTFGNSSKYAAIFEKGSNLYMNTDCIVDITEIIKERVR